VALEKVHGSNFCFITNGAELLGARRNAVLDPVETFYSWQLVRDKYAEAFHQLYHHLRAMPGHENVTECVSAMRLLHSCGDADGCMGG